MIHPTVEQAKILDDQNASYRIIHRPPTTSKGLHGNEITEQGVILCEIIDLVLNKPYVESRGPTEEEALASAIDLAKTATRPKTQAQIAQEHIHLSDENERLRKQLSRLNAEPEVVSTGELRSVKTALKQRGIKLVGKKVGSTDWLALATDRIREYDLEHDDATVSVAG